MADRVLTRPRAGRAERPLDRGRATAPVGRRRAAGRVGLIPGVQQDAAESGIARAAAYALFLLPFVGGGVVAATFADRPVFGWLLAEDHPIEWAQFGLLAFAVLAAVLGAVRMARQGHWGAAALYLVFALGAFVLAGEEISWGQRAFSLSEPAGLAGINDQHELNLHNIRDGSLNLDKLSDYVNALMSACLMALSLAVRGPRALTGRTRAAFARPAWQVISPPLVFVPALALSAFYPLLQVVPGVAGISAFWEFEEWTELCRYLSLAGLAGVAAAGYRVATHRRPARHGKAGRVTRPDLLEPPLVAFAVFAAALTVLFAVLTIHTGLRAING